MRTQRARSVPRRSVPPEDLSTYVRPREAARSSGWCADNRAPSRWRVCRDPRISGHVRSGVRCPDGVHDARPRGPRQLSWDASCSATMAGPVLRSPRTPTETMCFLGSETRSVDPRCPAAPRHERISSQEVCDVRLTRGVCPDATRAQRVFDATVSGHVACARANAARITTDDECESRCSLSMNARCRHRRPPSGRCRRHGSCVLLVAHRERPRVRISAQVSCRGPSTHAHLRWRRLGTLLALDQTQRRINP